MPNVQFIEKDAAIEADLLFIDDPILENKLDYVLKGAISFNKQREKGTFWMTTNGLYSVPKLAFLKKKDDLLQMVEEGKNIAFALSWEKPAELAFELLVNKGSLASLTFLCDQPKQELIRFQEIFLPLLKGISLAKELIAAPSNRMTPARFAERCSALSSQGVKVDIFDEIALKKMGAEAILAVGKGSVHPPRLVVMHYKGSDDDPIALVGKGICFDAGGIHLKTNFLNEMKWDKAGAGVVVGVLEALSLAKIPVSVVGTIALAENMPDGGALKPGDVIETLSGKTVEIVDTDCEGRLVLADSMTYVQQAYSPKILIDIGTLTRETFGALGGKYGGLFCNDQQLEKELISAGKRAQEELWPLPLGSFFAKHIRSQIADLKNAGIQSYGASSAAAEFLRAFLNQEIPWAHLDIAGVAWDIMKPTKGITAFGVRLLYEWLRSTG